MQKAEKAIAPRFGFMGGRGPVALARVRPPEPGKTALVDDSIMSLEARLSNLEGLVRQQTSLIRACGFPAACQILVSTGRISPAQVLPGIKDLLNSAVIESLLAHGPSTISELTRRLNSETGKGDRKTVRKKLVKLSASGVAVRFEDSSKWGLTPQFMEKWLTFVSSLATPSLERRSS